MHEIGYCEAVLDAVERRAEGRRVARLGVRVGALHRIVPAAFEQSFQLVAAGGVADSASTEVTIVASRAGCRACGDRFETADASPACPACGALDVTVEGGDELVLEWIEYAEERVGARSADGADVSGHRR
jgi:hydrogenase nickel incorporation protein HypA/HybF